MEGQVRALKSLQAGGRGVAVRGSRPDGEVVDFSARRGKQGRRKDGRPRRSEARFLGAVVLGWRANEAHGRAVFAQNADAGGNARNGAPLGGQAGQPVEVRPARLVGVEPSLRPHSM